MAVRVSAGLLHVPVIVKVKVPLVALLLVNTVMVEDPEEVTEAGLNVAVAPLANPLALNVTVPANPPEGATLTV